MDGNQQQIPTASVLRDGITMPTDGAGHEPHPDRVPLFPLYSTGQVVLASFLGGPLAGGWVLRTNFARLKNQKAGWATLLVGALASAVLMWFAFIVPSHFPSFFVAGPGILLMFLIAQHWQGATIEDHYLRGGPRGSSWRAAGIGLVGLVATVAMIFAVVWFQLPDKMSFGNCDVYYSDGASKGDAKQLGQALEQLGYFGPGEANAVKLERVDGQFSVALVVKDGVWNDAQYRELLQHFGRELAHALDRRVQVRLADSELNIKSTVGWFQPNQP